MTETAMKTVAAYKDPKNPGNSAAYHTGKDCIEEGCTNPAGTAWSPYWCFECNVKRIDRINKHLTEIQERYGSGKIGMTPPICKESYGRR